VLLAEQLALISLNPETGRHGAGLREVMNACLSGLLVAELMIDGTAARGEKDGTVVLKGPASGSRTLTAAGEVVAERGPKLRTVLSGMNRGLNRRLGTGTWDTTMAGLADAGVVASMSGGVRGTRFALLDAAARADLVADLRAAAAGDAPLDLRTAAVLSMVGPARLLEVIAPERATRRHARRRIDHALDSTEEAAVGREVRRVIADAAAAAAAAATVVIASST
jgi:hypothetical protein